jgi:hypothetical protein
MERWAQTASRDAPRNRLVEEKSRLSRDVVVHQKVGLESTPAQPSFFQDTEEPPSTVLRCQILLSGLLPDEPYSAEIIEATSAIQTRIRLSQRNVLSMAPCISGGETGLDYKLGVGFPLSPSLW